MHDYYKELADYLKRDVRLVFERCNYARFELAWRWEKYKEHNFLDEFYKDTDLYLFDLTMYCDHLQKRGTFDWFRKMIKEKEIKTMVDFGGGIGEYSIIASEMGVKCTHYDFEGQLLDYATHRFKKRKLDIKTYDLSHDFPEADLYVCMDVFEHLKDPVPNIEKISKLCKYMVCNPTEPPYNIIYPQHLSRFILPQFELIDRYLYKSNQT